MINSKADSLNRLAVRYTKFGGQSYCCSEWAGQNYVSLGGDYDLLTLFQEEPLQDRKVLNKYQITITVRPYTVTHSPETSHRINLSLLRL